MAKRRPRSQSQIISEFTKRVNSTNLPSEKEANRLAKEAREYLSREDEASAIGVLTEAIKLEPLHLESLMMQAEIMEKYGRKDPAIALLEQVVLQAPNDPSPYFNYARLIASKGRVAVAIAALKRAYDLDPNSAGITRLMAGLYGQLKLTEQQEYWAGKAVSIQGMAISRAKKEPKLTIVNLGTTLAGNLKTNIKKFSVNATQAHANILGGVDSDHITTVDIDVESIKSNPKMLKSLPQADIIFNGITIAEQAEDALQQAKEIVKRLALPTLNHPDAVLNSSRTATTKLLERMGTLIVPKIHLVEDLVGDIASRVRSEIEQEGFKAPVIWRIPGMNGKEHIHILQDLDKIEEANIPKGDIYLIQHHKVWFEDDRLPGKKIYPKYRAVLVGGRLYPAHLRFNIDDFNVFGDASKQVIQHYPWLAEMVEDFLDDPEKHLGKDRWEELRQALLAQELDYTGADFAPSTDEGEEGKFVIFEANAAMRSWLTDLPHDSPVQKAWQVIIEALHNHMCKKASVEPWEFNLPRGTDEKSVEYSDIEVEPDVGEEIVYLDFERYQELMKRRDFGYFRANHGLVRWDYHYRTVELIKQLGIEKGSQVLEMGTMGMKTVVNSHTFDHAVFWDLPYTPTYDHDALDLPWPQKDKQYEVFVALRVFMHLAPKQKECLAEAFRVANKVILLVPEEYKTRSIEAAKGLSYEQIVEMLGGIHPNLYIPTQRGPIYYFDTNSPSRLNIKQAVTGIKVVYKK